MLLKCVIFVEEYPELLPQAIFIWLTAPNAVLSPMSKASQEDTLDALAKLGVVVKLNPVVDYIDDTVYFGNGKTIQTKNFNLGSGVSAKNI
jgi:NADH dehydrogenase